MQTCSFRQQFYRGNIQPRCNYCMGTVQIYTDFFNIKKVQIPTVTINHKRRLASPLLFCAYTEQVMREAEITESGAVIGGRSISNLRYADDTALCGKSPQEINIVHKVNYAGRIRLLKLNARKTKLMVVGDDNANVSIDIDGETIAKVNSFKYLGTIKTSTGSCSEDIKARIGRA